MSCNFIRSFEILMVNKCAKIAKKILAHSISYSALKYMIAVFTF
jgi:hypothetical protein